MNLIIAFVLIGAKNTNHSSIFFYQWLNFGVRRSFEVSAKVICSLFGSVTLKLYFPMSSSPFFARLLGSIG